jgi:TRAP-type uncharacterized transport system fused permease subunit
MKAAALVVLLSLAYVPRSYAADDAPLLLVDVKCYTPDERANIAKAIVSKDARIKSLEADAGVPVGVVVALVVAGVVLGAGATVGGFAVAGRLR